MVEVGLAVTLTPVVADKPVAGDHVNEVTVPLAVRPVGTPLQIATPAPALTAGRLADGWFTVADPVAVQLLASVTITL
jgi:hypothetical protein